MTQAPSYGSDKCSEAILAVDRQLSSSCSWEPLLAALLKPRVGTARRRGTCGVAQHYWRRRWGWEDSLRGEVSRRSSPSICMICIWTAGATSTCPLTCRRHPSPRVRDGTAQHGLAGTGIAYPSTVVWAARARWKSRAWFTMSRRVSNGKRSVPDSFSGVS